MEAPMEAPESYRVAKSPFSVRSSNTLTGSVASN